MRIRLRVALSLVCAAAVAAVAPAGWAATLPIGFQETLIATGLAKPTAMALAPDGRIFICQQGGQLRVIKNGALLATPFLTVTADSTGERGLLGVALDPAFATNQFLYVYYTVPGSPAHNRLSRFTANGDVALAGSETILLELNPLGSATNHNGGAIHFRPPPDGKLYVAVGENANGANAQSLGNLLGKILRLNGNGTIPTDNPFYSTATGVNRAIWARGLRNPFTFAFQPTSGRMLINDVGQKTWEEINEGLAGANYGWPATEGATSDPRFVTPLYAYQHASGSPTGCAITGGAFYDPVTQQFPGNYVGNYFFADFCGGWIYRLDVSAPGSTLITPAFATGISFPVDLQVAEDGNLYYLARGTGSATGVLSRVRYNPAPSITLNPANITVSIGHTATFNVAATGIMPLAYQWQRNGSDITGATARTYMLTNAQLSNSGNAFRCIVTNSHGTATSNSATLTVVSTPRNSAGDFNGDGLTDLAVFRPSTLTWYVRNVATVRWGMPGDLPVPGDYDGDGVTDIAAYRPSTGQWFVRNQFTLSWGRMGDVPLPADYNNDGMTDLAVYRPSTGQWFVRNQYTVAWGLPNDVPVPGDYNGDGSADIAVFRPSTGQWFVRNQFIRQWGGMGDVPVPEDYDDDGVTDLAVYRPSTGQWLVRNQFTVTWGLPTDVPVPGDYNGDGTADVAVYRPSSGEWFVRNHFILQWGRTGDVPVVRP
jgi:glucose/arabinose dehydrogenase